MHDRFLAVLMVGLLAAAVCVADDEFEIRVYPAPRAEGPITVDGALDEPCWERAPLVGGFTRHDRPELVEVQTFFRVLYDDRRLYFGVICDEPLMDEMVPVAQARDAHAVFRGESIEIFVDPDHDHTDYYQFAVNSAASMYDSRKTDPSWNADIVAGVTLGEDGWTLEFAIPWEDLGVTPAPGVVLGFNVCRNRHIGNDRQWSNWSQTKANFHDPERFGHLVLSPTPEQIGRLGDEFRKGGRRGPIVVFSHEGFAQTSYRALAAEALANLQGAVDDLEAVMRGEDHGPTRRELRRLVVSYRADVAPLAAAIADERPLDAAEWTRMNLRINELAQELEEAVWSARLAALLADI